MPFSELELVVGKLVFEAEVLAAVSALVVGGVERVWSLDLGGHQAFTNTTTPAAYYCLSMRSKMISLFPERRSSLLKNVK